MVRSLVSNETFTSNPCDRAYDRFGAKQIPSASGLVDFVGRENLEYQQNCEWRISIYGRYMDEWDKLARWIVNNELYCNNVRWLIQVPRLYDVYKANGSVETFQDIILST
jgi:hypothetical protein